MIDLTTNKKILKNILDLENSEFKPMNMNIVKIFSDKIPRETTINRLIKDFQGINETIDLVLENISIYFNSEKTITNMKNIFNKMSSNTNFDYYKEIKNGQ